MRKILQAVTLLSLFGAWIPAAMAQNTGNLTGKVTDRAGAAVPNATVIVTNSSSSASQRVLTAPDGRFTIMSLPPGLYRVEVESAGFKRSSQQTIELVTGKPADFTIVLEGGDPATTVEAQATARVIQDDNAQIAKSLGGNVINELPGLDRNYQHYLDLIAGVGLPAPAGSVTESPQLNRVWNTNGQPNSSNLRLLDGAKNHEPATGVSVHVMPLHAVKQLNVVNSGYEPQFGRAGGSVVNVETSPGTNDFHGNVFYLYSSDQFNARNYFNQTPAEKSHFRSSQFGGAAGGAIAPNRVFFYLGYEGDYIREGRTQIATVPTADFRAGNFSAVPDFTLFHPATGTNGMNRIPLPGGMVPSGLINPTSRAIANALPLPNHPGLINNFVGSPVDRSDGHRATGRLDFYAAESTNVFVRYGYSNYLTYSPSIFGSEELGGGSNARLRNHNGGVSLTHRFSPTFTVDALANYSRYNNNRWGTGAADAAAFGFGDVTANGQLPGISIAGLQIGNNPLFPYQDVTDSYNATVNAGMSKGRHTLKFGIDIWHSRMTGYEQFMAGRQAGYTFAPGASLNAGWSSGALSGFPNAFGAFMMGYASQVNGFTSGARPHFRATEYAGYVGDTFRVTERFSLSFGVRYEAFSPVETRGNSSFFSFGSSQFTPFETGDSDRSGTQPWDTNNFAPRFGFAYRIGERTVVRGGYAVSFFRPNLTWYAQSFLPDGFQTFQQGLGTSYQIVPGNYAQNPLASGVGTNGLPSGVTAIVRDDIETPYMQTYNFQIQHDFGGSASLDVGYVGNFGRHLPLTQNVNTAMPGTGIPGLPIAGRTAGLYDLSTGLTSNYNALQVTFNKRFANWISFAGQYTWSRAMDYGDGMMPLMNNLNRSDNYGPAHWDRRHVFTLGHVWEPLGANFRRAGWAGALLGGWKVNGILRAFGGTPVTLGADPLLCACPGNTARADVVGVGTVTRVVPDPAIYGYSVGVPYSFPVRDFQQPAAGSFGNLGRNSVYTHDFWERGAWNYDASVTKTFQISEQNRLELQGDMFNVLNTPHFAAPVIDVNSVNFGRSFSTVPGFGARTIRIGARYVF